MTHVLRVPGKLASAAISEGVASLLAEVSDEFVPPLDARADTLSLSVKGCSRGLVEYLQRMRHETWLLALKDNELVGLLSYIAGHQEAALSRYSPCAYVTTVAVTQPARRSGTARLLYEALEAHAYKERLPFLATRTWSTNSTHLPFLVAGGFKEVHHVLDDRAPGIHTLYFVRQVRSSW